MFSQRSVPTGCWRFGQYELDGSTRELRKNGLRIHLQEQPRRILEKLLARPGEVVTREELREWLWPADTFVDFERSLNAAVAKLRQVLSDSAERPRYIETVARRGYRFAAPVETSPAEEEPAAVSSIPMAVQTRRTTLPWNLRTLVWPAVAVVALGFAVFSVSRTTPRVRPGESPAVRFVVPKMEGTRIHPMSAISPDGSKLAFVAIDSSGQRELWLRALASEMAVRLENTDGAAMPFFSPDSQHIAFFADGRLKRIQAAGGTPQTLCDVEQPAGGTWSRDNVIVFSQHGHLFRVAAGGGAASELARPAAAAGESKIDTWPQFLPDGRRFIVSTATHKGQINTIRTEVFLGWLDSGRRRFLANSRSRAAYANSGHLLFRRDNGLVAQKLDLDREQLVGEQQIVAQDLNPASAGVLVDVKPGLPVGVVPAPFSASDNGVLVYHSSPPPKTRLVWLNRGGERLDEVAESRDYMQIFISPDEQRAAVGVRERGDRNHWNIWLLDLRTKVLSRLSFGEGRDADPAWAPGSDRVVYGAYRADRGENIDLMEVSLRDRTAKRIFYDGRANKPEAWSPDGKCVLFRRDEQDVFCLPTAGDAIPRPLLQTPYIKQGFRFSPDGRSVAYASAESGRVELYVSRFPAMTEPRQISIGGGYGPVWRKDGKELFYMNELGQVMSVAVKGSSPLEFGAPKLLFQARMRNNYMPQFGVTGNGQKFLVIEEVASRASDERMVVMTHWTASVHP